MYFSNLTDIQGFPEIYFTKFLFILKQKNPQLHTMLTLDEYLLLVLNNLLWVRLLHKTQNIFVIVF